MVGWYSTGPRLREADLDITDLMSNYCDMPLLVICEVQVSIWQWCHFHHIHIRSILSFSGPSGEHGFRGRMMADSVPCAMQPKAMGLPTTAYYATDEIREVPAYPPAPIHAVCKLPESKQTQSVQSTRKNVWVRLCSSAISVIGIFAGRHAEEPEGLHEHPY